MKPSAFLLFIAVLFLANCKKDKPEPNPEPEPEPELIEPTPTYLSFDALMSGTDNAALMSSDGNLLLCFYTSNSGSAGIIKLASDQFTDSIWNYSASAVAMAETTNGEIYACEPGRSLIKINSSGEFLWRKDYDSLNLGWLGGFTNIIATSDGNLLIATQTESIINQSVDAVHLLKVKTDGDTIWTRTYTDGVQAPRHLLETHAGDYVLTGSYKEISDDYMLKVSSEGETIWEKKIQVSLKCFFSSIELDNGDLLVTGKMVTSQGGDENIILFRIDRDGNVVWFKNYGELGVDEEGRSIRRNNDGTFTIAGFTETDTNRLVLVKVDENGNQIWYKRLSVVDDDEGVYNLLKAPNDDNILVGSYWENNLIPKSFVIRTDGEGNLK